MPCQRRGPCCAQVELGTGERIGSTKLLPTTGASPRRLRIRGSRLDGVHYLRTIDDTDKLRDAIRSGGRVVVIGGGWIGMEVAAAARDYGCDATVAEPPATPLHSALGPGMGGFFGDLHRRNDVGAIGARPNTELADRAGLTVDNRVVVDASLRTDDPDIYAAGDVANSFNAFYRRHIRVEHWAGALHGGTATARAMLGQSVVNDARAFHAFWLVGERGGSTG